MCESLDRMREEYGTKRYLQGEAEGLQKGRIQGEETVELKILTNLLKKGKEEGILTILKSLLNKELSDSYILEITGVSSELLLKAKQALN